MNLNIQKQYFLLSDIFEITIAPSEDIGNLEEGSVPFIGRSDFNNGLQGYVHSTKINKSNCITISMVGTNVALWQEKDFIASQNIAILRNEKLTRLSALYICSILNYEIKNKFSYGRTISKELLEKMQILLPADKNKNPNYQSMEDYIKTLKYKNISTKNKKSKNDISSSLWETFYIKDLFKMFNGKGITKEEIEFNPGDFNAVQSGEENNGIIGKIDKEYCIEKKYTLTESPCLTVARTGSAGFVSYQPKGCVVGDSAKILQLKDKKYANKYIYLFLKTILMSNKYKYTYGRKVIEEKYLNEQIMLPANRDVTGKIVPNWQFMENYIKSLPYGDRI